MENGVKANSDPLALVNGAPVGSKSNWVVQKFGGTSIGKFCSNIIDHVIL